VRPRAGIPSSAARWAIGNVIPSEVFCSILHAPSSSEYSLWTWRCATAPLTFRILPAGSDGNRGDPATCEACAVIWLLRHGEAEDSAPDDASRRLTEKGERQSRTAGRALAKLGVELEACLSSPKVRALDTARLACEALEIEVEEAESLRGGDFDPDEVVAGRGNVLLVGHEPDFSRAIQRATGARVEIKKGGLAAIDDGLLIALLRPRQIREIAG
jgi:phosphohistidine phosphatase